MYVYAAHIKNYRLFFDVWFFPNSTLNCVIGSNNSGKSALLKALGIILDPKNPTYRDDFISQFDFYNRNTEDPIEIDLWLKEHPDEPQEIVTRLFDKFSKWKEVKTNDGSPINLIPVISEPLEESQGDEKSPVLDLLRIKFKASWNENEKTADHETVIMDEADNPGEAFNSSLKKIIGFSFIPAKREPLNDISLNRRSIFSQFLDDNVLNPVFRKLLDALEENRNELLQTEGIKDVISRLKSIVASQIIGELPTVDDDAISLTFLNSEISKLRTESCFSVKVANKIVSESETSKPIHVPLEYQGDGIQNIFLLISLAEIVQLCGKSQRAITVIEEPEQHLEPSQAKWLYSELCKCFLTAPQCKNNIVQKGESDREIILNNQLFITTHSPALVGEFAGIDCLVMMPVRGVLNGEQLINSASHFPTQIKKSFERNRELYSPILLSRYVLIVEGPSELGFLPVAFKHYANHPWENPFHLGLEILNGECKQKAIKHAKNILPFKRPVHVLIDHDANKDVEKDIMSLYSENGFHSTCWGDGDKLPFTIGTDLEIILASEVNPDILFAAIKEVYENATNQFNRDKWNNQCDKLTDNQIAIKLKAHFPSNISEIDISLIGTDESIRRAYLYVLLHEPHSCKSTREMRIIAEYLVSKHAIPKTVEKLYKRVLQWIKKQDSVLLSDYLWKKDGNRSRCVFR